MPGGVRPDGGLDRRPGQPNGVNHLAHFLLSGSSPEALAGSLLGDFVKGRVSDSYHPPVRDAILLHRRIDAFTDSHPVVARSRHRISSGRRRYAGILVDLFYDHFLARSWEVHAAVSLPDFCAAVYAGLDAGRDLLPERAARMATRMAAEDWLISYREVDGITAALARVSRCLSRPNDLGDATEELLGSYSALTADFDEFFPCLSNGASPELIAHGRVR